MADSEAGRNMLTDDIKMAALKGAVAELGVFEQGTNLSREGHLRKKYS